MNVRYIDTHCHLQFEEYAHDRDEIIARMSKGSIAGIVVGVDLESSKKALALAEKHEHLFASVGLHPNHVRDFVNPSSDDGFTKSGILKLAKNKKVVAIGECGLDYFRKINDEIKNAQKELLQKHLKLAVALDKPIIIHARSSKGTNDAYQDLLLILKEAKIKNPKLRGDIHFFAGNLEKAKDFFELDFAISFTAVITFSRDYDEIIKAVPLRNILSETDAPYVAPASRRGERNDPLAVIDVVQQIAEIRGESFKTVRQTLLANALRVFSLTNI
jgi:TatD DNase family protein